MIIDSSRSLVTASSVNRLTVRKAAAVSRVCSAVASSRGELSEYAKRVRRGKSTAGIRAADSPHRPSYGYTRVDLVKRVVIVTARELRLRRNLRFRARSGARASNGAIATRRGIDDVRTT